MQIEKNIEQFIRYLLIAGFLLTCAGILITIFQSGMPLNLSLVMMGIALLLMGFLFAKMFGEIINGRHKMG